MVITFVLGTAACVATLFLDTGQSGWSSFLLAIGTGLLASSLYSFFTGVIIQDEQTNALVDYLGEQLRAMSAEEQDRINASVGQLQQDVKGEIERAGQLASSEISSLGIATRDQVYQLSQRAISSLERYRPDHDWPESSTPDPDYNQKLHSSLRDCDVYYFQGVTAQTSIARLASIPRSECPKSAFFLIADPTRPDTVVRREFRDNDLTESIDPVARTAKLKESVMVSIVGAHALRQRIPRVELVLMTEPPIDRAEILGNYAFISMYSMQRDRTNAYPPSAAFSSRTYVFQTHREECITLVESGYMRRIVVPAHDDTDSFLKLLGGLDIQLTAEDYRGHLATFKERVHRVSTELHPQLQTRA